MRRHKDQSNIKYQKVVQEYWRILVFSFCCLKFLQRATSSNKKHGKRFQHIASMWQWLWHILFEKEILWCSVTRAGVGLWRGECSWLVCNVKLRQVTGGMTVALGRATAKTWAPDIFAIGIYLASEYILHQNISEYTYFKKHSWYLLSKQQWMALCDCTSYVWLILIWFSNVMCSFNGVKTNSLILEPLSRPTIISLVTRMSMPAYLRQVVRSWVGFLENRSFRRVVQNGLLSQRDIRWYPVDADFSH